MNILRRLIFYANFLQANYSNFLIVWIYHTAKWVSSEKYMFCGPSIHWNICFNFNTAVSQKLKKKCKSLSLFFFYFDIEWTTIIVKLALFLKFEANCVVLIQASDGSGLTEPRTEKWVDHKFKKAFFLHIFFSTSAIF